MSAIDFRGRVHIVTGAGQGIGAAYAVALASRGARVVVNDIGTGLEGGGTSSGPADRVVDAIRTAGGEAVASTDSVATAPGCDAVVKTAVEAFGRLDGLIHNASVHPPLKPVSEFAEEDVDRTFAVHLYGAFYLTRSAWPQLAASSGRILFITSAVGLWGHRNIAPYAAAKTGVVGLARAVAHDGIEHGIAANVLSVGAATRASARSLDDAPRAKAWWERYMDASFVAAAGTWLVHPDCSANGRIFDAFGGHMSEIVFAETPGHTQLEWTPEDYRDQFAKITERETLVPVDTAGDWQRIGLESLLQAGAARLEPGEVLPEFMKILEGDSDTGR